MMDRKELVELKKVWGRANPTSPNKDIIVELIDTALSLMGENKKLKERVKELGDQLEAAIANTIAAEGLSESPQPPEGDDPLRKSMGYKGPTGYGSPRR
jgi:hypothetical protein